MLFAPIALLLTIAFSATVTTSSAILTRSQDVCSKVNGATFDEAMVGSLTLTLMEGSDDSFKQFGDCDHLYVVFEKDQTKSNTKAKMTVTSNLANTVDVQVSLMKSIKNTNDASKNVVTKYVYEAVPGQDCSYDIPDGHVLTDAAGVKVQDADKTPTGPYRSGPYDK